MMRIKVNDTVIILSGKNKGKTGAILEIDSDKNRVRVKGVAIVTRHVKARKQGQIAGIKKEEGYINASNVMLVSPADNKPCRVNFKVQDGKKVRVNNRTQEIL